MAGKNPTSLFSALQAIPTSATLQNNISGYFMKRLVFGILAVLFVAPAFADPLPRLTIAVEGGAFWDNRNDVGFLGAFGTNSAASAQGAISFDYRFDALWHMSAQFRYMNSTTSSDPLGNIRANPLPSLCTPRPGASACQMAVGDAAMNTTQRNFVYDAAIGRDVSLPFGLAQAKFGFRFADIKTTSTMSGVSAAYATATGPGSAVSAFAVPGSASASSSAPFGYASATATDRSTSFQQIAHFAGAGPRLALEGETRPAGNWSIDYTVGTAMLIGDRTADLSTSYKIGEPFGNSLSTLVSVFNVDSSVGLSYRFSPMLKATAGYRVDAYFNALPIGNASGGNANFVDHGAFGRLTANF